jgi:P-type Na+/K+ transporter
VILCGLAFRRDGVAVYPISPPAALYINTVAAGLPALALGVEPTAKDAMDIGPENFQKIFTASWYMDTIGYGVVIGGQALANFVIVQYGVANGAADISPNARQQLVHIPLHSLTRIAFPSAISLLLASSLVARSCSKLEGPHSQLCS